MSTAHRRDARTSATLASSSSGADRLGQHRVGPQPSAIFRYGASNFPEMAMIPMPGDLFTQGLDGLDPLLLRHDEVGDDQVHPSRPRLFECLLAVRRLEAAG